MQATVLPYIVTLRRQRLPRGSSFADKEELIRREHQAARERIHRQASGLSAQVGIALCHIRDHLFDPDLNVATLRRRCRLRNHNLTTLFRSHLGDGIRSFIEKERIETAKRLLYYEELEIWRIAFAVGFGSPETFCRAFRRRIDLTPSAYRRRLRSISSSSRAVR